MAAVIDSAVEAAKQIVTECIIYYEEKCVVNIIQRTEYQNK